MPSHPHPCAQGDDDRASTDLPYGSARVTAPRAAIASVVSACEGAFTVDELVERVRAASPEHASPATVYRAVAAMAAAGYVERVGSRDGSALYARCATDRHHHHIVCDGCGRTVKAECPLGDSLATDAAVAGFTITRHEVTLYGLCASCSACADGTAG